MRTRRSKEKKETKKKRHAFYLYLFIYLSIYYLLDAWFLSFSPSSAMTIDRALTRAIVIVIVP